MSQNYAYQPWSVSPMIFQLCLQPIYTTHWPTFYNAQITGTIIYIYIYTSTSSITDMDKDSCCCLKKKKNIIPRHPASQDVTNHLPTIPSVFSQHFPSIAVYKKPSVQCWFSFDINWDGTILVHEIFSYIVHSWIIFTKNQSIIYIYTIHCN